MPDNRLMKHMEYLSEIVRNNARDKNGNPPTLSDRIDAGGCLLTIYTVVENGFELDVEKAVTECKKVYGSKWAGPEDAA